MHRLEVGDPPPRDNMDALRSLQRAAQRCGCYIAPGTQIARVIVFDATGRKVCDLAVPAEMLPWDAATGKREPGADADGIEVPDVRPGWDVTDRRAFYDGRLIAVAASRLKLLATLVDADGPLSAKELASAAFDRQTSEENVRYHIKALREELGKAFVGFEGDIVPGDGAGGKGYALALR